MSRLSSQTRIRLFISILIAAHGNDTVLVLLLTNLLSRVWSRASICDGVPLSFPFLSLLSFPHPFARLQTWGVAGTF